MKPSLAFGSYTNTPLWNSSSFGEQDMWMLDLESGLRKAVCVRDCLT